MANEINKNRMIRAKAESDYLLISNKTKCERLLTSSDLDENNIIDILISLHIILETGLNALYRHLTLFSLKKKVDPFKIIENLDNISFIDKTMLFVYNSKFDFAGKEELADKYHSIIDTIKDFAGVRNKLLHGHSISTILEEGIKTRSRLKKEINVKKMKKQIVKFCFIVEGMRFYLDCLDTILTEAGKESLKESYLEDNFLPIMR